MKIRTWRFAGIAIIGALLVLNYSIVFADVKANPDIVYNSSNNPYLVTYLQAATFDSTPSISGSIRDPDGTPTSGIPEFSIGGPTIFPEKAAAAFDFENDRYLVVWANYGIGPRLYGRFVGADGTVDPAGVPTGPFPIGRELGIGSEGQTDPSVAFSATSNNFLVVWANSTTEVTSDIYGQIVNADGSFPGGSFANFPISEQSGDESVPVVAHDSANDVYLVAWEDSGTGGPDSSGIYGQVLFANGTLEGGILTITSTATPNSDISSPSIAYDNVNQNFMVVWDSYVSLTDSRFERIDGRLIKVSSDTITDGFVVLDIGSSFFIYGAEALTNIRIAPIDMDAQNPSVASSASGNYLVVWEDGRNFSTADFAPDIYGQLVNADGTLDNGNFSVYTAIYLQLHPSVAFNSVDNNFAVAFEDNTSADIGNQDIQIVLVSSAGADTTPPVIDTANVNPPDGATSVPVDTDIVIRITDDFSGVNLSSVVVSVFEGGTPVYTVNNWEDYASDPNLSVTGGPLDYILTFNPPSDFPDNMTQDVSVNASDNAGNAINPVYTFSFTTAAITIPKPENLRIIPPTTLVWDAVPIPISGYWIYYDTDGSGPPYDGTGLSDGDSPIWVGDVTQYTLSGLADNIRYYFAVVADDGAGNMSNYSDEVEIFIDTDAPDPPDVIGDTPTNDATPTWSWTPGGGGNGTYRYQLDSEAGTWQTTTDTFFTPSGSLSDGPHILYVQETDDATNWSASGSSTILVDTISPTTFGHAPVDNQPNVAVNSNIVVHVLDSGSGVDIGSIAITVTEDGAAVSGSVDIPGTPSDYTVTFDPSSDFGNLASIEVTVEASDFAGNLMTDTYDFVTADVGGTSWDIADDDGDGILNSEEDLLGTSRTTKTIFVRPKERNEADDGWEYWPDFVQVLFPYAGKDGFADALALTDAGIEVVVIGAPTPYLPMQAFDYDPGDPAKNIDLNIDPTGTPIDFDPSTSNWQGPNCDILEIEYYPPETEKYCTVVGGCNKNFGHIYFTNNDDYGWDTKGITPNTSQHHGYYKPRLYGFAQQNYFEEAWFTQLQQDQLPQYETADPFPPGYLCNFSSNPADNQCYDFEPTHSSPLNLNLGDPTSGSPDDWVEFKPITFDATDKSIDCFDEDCDLTEPLAVTATQFDFSAVLRRTTLHEWSHAFLTATPGDHCDNENCILQVGVEDWTLHPFGTSCGHKAAIQGAVHNSRH